MFCPEDRAAAFGQCLGHHIVERGRHGRGRVAGEIGRELDRHGLGAGAERFQRHPQALVGEDGGMDAAGQLAQLRERLGQLAAGIIQQLRGLLGLAE